jgi:surfeit locus 1 family protein
MHAPRPLTLTASGIAATAAVFVVAAVCVRLGFWQLDRLEQRRRANAGLEDRIAAAPIALSAAPRDTAGLIMRAARLRGTWDGEYSFALAGRSRAGAPGAHVLAPLRLADGGAVLVDRGFVPSADAATVAAEARLSGPATVFGRLKPLDPEADADGTLRPPAPGGGSLPTWFARSPDGLGEHIPYALAPVYLAAESATTDGPYPAPLQAPELDEGPHLGYALQWFSFAVIALVGWAAMVVRRPAGERAAAREEAPARAADRDPSDS